MYRTLIVDDEQLMRQYLSNHLAELCPDFYVSGIACDGLEAVQLLARQEFDLVITDIKMPEMDGLNLAKYINDSFPSTKVIIISGYNEFEYARLGIKYGVIDYLLKPLSDDAVIDTLSRVKSELRAEALRNISTPSPAEYQSYSDQELKSALFSAILLESSTLLHQLYGIMNDRKLSFLKAHSCVMLICLDELSILLHEKKVLENTSYKLELNQLCRSYCDQNQIAIAFQRDYAVLLLTAMKEEELSPLADNIFKEVSHAFVLKSKLKLMASYGNTVSDMVSLTSSYSSAVKAITLSLTNAPSPIGSNYYISQNTFIYELNIILDALYSDFIAKNSSKMHSDLYQYVALFQDNQTIAGILRFGTYLIRYIGRKCSINSEYTIAAFQELTAAIDQGIHINSFDDKGIHSLFMKALRVLDHENLLTLLSEPVSIVENAKEFIYRHYPEQISLAMIADNFNVTPSYFSDLFHKSTGEPYTKFLTRIRMEQALLLLKSNPGIKIYKVAEKTGFVSVKHFNNVFKKYYGFTPTEYLMKNGQP